MSECLVESLSANIQMVNSVVGVQKLDHIPYDPPHNASNAEGGG